MTTYIRGHTIDHVLVLEFYIIVTLSICSLQTLHALLPMHPCFDASHIHTLTSAHPHIHTSTHPHIHTGVEDPSPEYCTQLINRYEPTDEGKAQGLMSNDGEGQGYMTRRGRRGWEISVWVHLRGTSSCSTYIYPHTSFLPHALLPSTPSHTLLSFPLYVPLPFHTFIHTSPPTYTPLHTLTLTHHHNTLTLTHHYNTLQALHSSW